MAWVFEGTVLPSGETEQVTIAAWEPGQTGALDPLPGAFALRGLVDGHCHLTLGRGVRVLPYVDLERHTRRA